MLLTRRNEALEELMRNHLEDIRQKEGRDPQTGNRADNKGKRKAGPSKEATAKRKA
jgi:hypothetical protein